MITIRYILAAITLLLLGILVASAQTTNAPAQTATADPSSLLHSLSGIYGIFIVAAGWVTHANWPRILDAYEWIGNQGGIWGILRKLIIGKKIVAALFLCAFALNSIAQETIPGALAKPVATVTGYLQANTNAPAATNWTVAPYASKSGDHWGGGLAAVYYVNPYVGTQIRAQYLDIGGGSSRLWLPNGTITLQSVYRPFGESIPITLRPMLELGAATDMDRNLMAIAGSGAELDIYSTHSTALVQRVSVFYGVEKWEGRDRSLRVQQAGIAINLNVGNILKKVFH